MKGLRKDTISISVLIVGVILTIGIIFFDFFYSRFWILALLFDIAVGLGLFVLLLIGFYKDNFRSLKIGAAFILIISMIFLLKSNYLKSQVVLEANLNDDLAGLSLTLRKNGEFEMVSTSLFYSEKFTGNYQIEGNKIIFLDRPYDNEFVPDTIMIVDDKIILRLDKDSLPVTDFASYFDIKKNNLNAP